jgi:hypothetical protein
MTDEQKGTSRAGDARAPYSMAGKYDPQPDEHAMAKREYERAMRTIRSHAAHAALLRLSVSERSQVPG